MYQCAWLELYEGRWYLLTDIKSNPSATDQKWDDGNKAILELMKEGWNISGKYPNEFSNQLKLGNRYRGYGLIRTIPLKKFKNILGKFPG